MIIRFLDNKDRCMEVTTPETPVLLYMTPSEKAMMNAGEAGDCLFIIDNQHNEEETKSIMDKLNTKDNPIRMKG